MDKLQGLIDQVVEIVKGSKDFAAAQTPDFVRQYLILNICNCVGWFVFSLIMLCISWKFAWNLKCTWDSRDPDGRLFLGFITVVVWFSSLFGVIANIENVFEIWLAPKAYLVTHLIELAAKK